MSLFINTSLKASHPTTLTKTRIQKLKKDLESIDLDEPLHIQYAAIKPLLETLDRAGLTNMYDQMEVATMKASLEGILSGKRGSKPYEFINVIEKILDNIYPYAAEGGRRKTRRRRRRHQRL